MRSRAGRSGALLFGSIRPNLRWSQSPPLTFGPAFPDSPGIDPRHDFLKAWTHLGGWSGDYPRSLLEKLSMSRAFNGADTNIRGSTCQPGPGQTNVDRGQFQSARRLTWSRNRPSSPNIVFNLAQIGRNREIIARLRQRSAELAPDLANFVPTWSKSPRTWPTPPRPTDVGPNFMPDGAVRGARQQKSHPAGNPPRISATTFGLSEDRAP